MKAVMALFDSDLREELFTIMELCEIKNYTHFVNLRGSSTHGKKDGSVAWPGSNEILLLILSPEQRETFKNNISHYKDNRDSKPGLLVFDWQLDSML